MNEKAYILFLNILTIIELKLNRYDNITNFDNLKLYGNVNDIRIEMNSYSYDVHLWILWILRHICLSFGCIFAK